MQADTIAIHGITKECMLSLINSSLKIVGCVICIVFVLGSIPLASVHFDYVDNTNKHFQLVTVEL